MTPATERRETCKWTQPDIYDMPGVYEGDCGVVWSFGEGDRAENECWFCPRCGGRIVERKK